MRNARIFLIGAATLAAAACNGDGQDNAQNNAGIDGGLPTTSGADIETLPPDESSATPSNELQNGFVSDDANVETSNSE